MTLVRGKQIAIAPDGITTTNLNANAVTPAKADLTQIWAFTAAPSYNADPVGVNDLVRKSYVDSVAIGGRTWKEVLLVPQQLIGGGSADIAQAEVCFVSINPTIGDTFVISSGGSIETYTFKASRTVTFDVAIGGSASATQTNLVTSIVSDSTLWTATVTSGLDKYFALSPTSTVVVYRRVAIATATDRIYGSQTAAAGIKVFTFTGNDYSFNAGVEVNIPSTDPGVKQFGIGRILSALSIAETHLIAKNAAVYSWDNDDQIWQETDIGALVAGNGISKSGNTIQALADPEASIIVTSSGIKVGVLASDVEHGNRGGGAIHTLAIASGANGFLSGADKAKLDGLSAIVYATTILSVGTANAAGSSTSVVRGDHVHAAPVTTRSNKNMIGSLTSSDGQLATATTIANPNALSSYIGARINGLHVLVGDGTKVAVACYLSGDGGVTARAMSAVVAGDSLYWNQSVAGYNLDATDRIDLEYESF